MKKTVHVLVQMVTVETTAKVSPYYYNNLIIVQWIGNSRHTV